MSKQFIMHIKHTRRTPVDVSAAFRNVKIGLEISGHKTIVAKRPVIKSHVTFGTLISEHCHIHE